MSPIISPTTVGNLKSAAVAHKKPIKIDKRLYDTIFAEVGGGAPEEVAAVASVFLNTAREKGYEAALKRSSAYNKRSDQFKKASFGQLNPYEAKIYVRNQSIIDNLAQNPVAIAPFTHFENVKAFGEPYWAKNQPFTDIGRQRFYTIDDAPLKGPKE